MPHNLIGCILITPFLFAIVGWCAVCMKDKKHKKIFSKFFIYAGWVYLTLLFIEGFKLLFK